MSVRSCNPSWSGAELHLGLELSFAESHLCLEPSSIFVTGVREGSECHDRSVAVHLPGQDISCDNFTARQSS